MLAIVNYVAISMGQFFETLSKILLGLYLNCNYLIMVIMFTILRIYHAVLNSRYTILFILPVIKALSFFYNLAGVLKFLWKIVVILMDVK